MAYSVLLKTCYNIPLGQSDASKSTRLKDQAFVQDLSSKVIQALCLYQRSRSIQYRTICMPKNPFYCIDTSVYWKIYTYIRDPSGEFSKASLVRILKTSFPAVASWLVCSSPERAVRVRAMAEDIVLCSWARHFTLTVPLSTQVYKWVPAKLCWG